MKAFAEEYQQFLEEQRTYQHLESSDGMDTEGDLETSRLSQKSGEKSDEEVWIAFTCRFVTSIGRWLETNWKR